MTERRKARNARIKNQICKLQDEGFSLKEAIHVVSDRWYLSYKHVEHIYYETPKGEKSVDRKSGLDL